ncbi:hypothetical protein BGX27_000274 [Mortierella sp. AM989]|nr:hypothetical protein BGX27_000274 [Mortierella sp. AM989]
MTAVRPIELPETMFRIAHFLEKHDLVQCICVCKLWNELLLSLVWEEVIIAGGGPRGRAIGPSIDDLKQHRELVHTLEVHDNIPGRYTMIFPNLHTLELGPGLEAEEPTALGDPTALIMLNPSLTHLRISSLDRYLLAPFWRAVSTLSSLKSLDLTELGVEFDIEVFWIACANLESLRLRYSMFSDRNYGDKLFTQLRSLVINSCETEDHSQHLELIRRCPNLEELTWYLGMEPQALKAFANETARGLWPRLGMLRLGYDISDDLLGPIIAGIQKITRLDMCDNGFGQLSFQALAHHFPTLVELDLQNCPNLIGAMLCEVMCSCSHLKKLWIGSITAKDIIESRPWVCHSLTTLQIRILFRESEQDLQPLIFERLSYLTQLETLDISRSLEKRPHKTLDFRLRSGLGMLASLKSIRNINVFQTAQLLMEEEVRWMLEHWKNLDRFNGDLNQDTQLNEILVSMLRARGIRT